MLWSITRSHDFQWMLTLSRRKFTTDPSWRGHFFYHYMKSMSKVKERIKELTFENILKTQVRQKKNFDKIHKIPSFRVGSHILIKMTRQVAKMESDFTRPYEIIEEIGTGIYRLKNLKTQKVLGKSYNSIRFSLGVFRHSRCQSSSQGSCLCCIILKNYLRVPV